MPRLFVALLMTVLLMLQLSGCKKEDSSTSADSFTDNLTLGTGLNSSNLFQLVGEGTTFKGVNVNIYWRLESKDDMAGSAVNIKIEKLVSGVYSTFQTSSYPSTQSYGHIMLSSFSLPQTGSFRATGILVATNKSVATQDFTVQP
jgi:hypothetical protein